MAQFAPVAPIQILEALKKNGALGTYHLLLAHHVLEHPDRFRDLFADQRNCTIIMDNSLVELGDSEGEEKVLEACNIVNGTAPVGTRNWIIPVLTDVMGDGAATREKAEASYEKWMSFGSHYPFMVVAQGGNGGRTTISEFDAFKDFCSTVDKFLLDPKFSNIQYVGIPRFLTGLVGTRQSAVQYVNAVRPDIGVHLLGFSDDVVDDVITAQDPSVEGIDSAVPLRFSYNLEGDKLYTPTRAIPPRPKDWFEKGEYDNDVFINLQNIRTWVA